MKLLPFFPVFCLILCNPIHTLNAQENPPPPLPQDGKPEIKPRDGKPGWFNKTDRGDRPLMPQPFLMAGDPRFQKMLLIALSPAEQVQDKLAAWPEFQQMDEDKRARLKQSMEGFRDHIRRVAEDEAERMGLNLSEQRKKDFVRAYWKKRIAAEEPLRKEVEDRSKAVLQNIRDELKQEFQ